MIQTLLDYYRLPAESLNAVSLAVDSVSGAAGYFQFGTQNICYGRCGSGTSKELRGSSEFEALKDVRRDGSVIHLPFDFNEVIENLR